jgi:hypothetical protein
LTSTTSKNPKTQAEQGFPDFDFPPGYEKSPAVASGNTADFDLRFPKKIAKPLIKKGTPREPGKAGRVGRRRRPGAQSKKTRLLRNRVF